MPITQILDSVFDDMSNFQDKSKLLSVLDIILSNSPISLRQQEFLSSCTLEKGGDLWIGSMVMREILNHPKPKISDSGDILINLIKSSLASGNKVKKRLKEQIIKIRNELIAQSIKPSSMPESKNTQVKISYLNQVKNYVINLYNQNLELMKKKSPTLYWIFTTIIYQYSCNSTFNKNINNFVTKNFNNVAKNPDILKKNLEYGLGFIERRSNILAKNPNEFWTDVRHFVKDVLMKDPEIFKQHLEDYLRFIKRRSNVIKQDPNEFITDAVRYIGNSSKEITKNPESVGQFIDNFFIYMKTVPKSLSNGQDFNHQLVDKLNNAQNQLKVVIKESPRIYEGALIARKYWQTLTNTSRINSNIGNAIGYISPAKLNANTTQPIEKIVLSVFALYVIGFYLRKIFSFSKAPINKNEKIATVMAENPNIIKKLANKPKAKQKIKPMKPKKSTTKG